ncbi:MAG: UbiA family prenyltransferase [Bacteroidota bacterium]|nr:UbiA family prenyltransferase [Bacteroidota bacterium]
MLHRSTIQLLRVPFSFFLMPVYWFALSTIPLIDWTKAILIFIILHLLVYPSSNGYNSFMDRDETPIGGIANPMQPTQQLFFATVVLDAIAIILSLFVNLYFTIGIVVYILFSRAYSYRKIRLKRYPIIGYLTVILNQGALTFWMVYKGASAGNTSVFPTIALMSATFLIGGFYPITQVYQHQADKKDGVKTISILLGIKGTFGWCAAMYAIAFGLLFAHFQRAHQMTHFLILQFFFIPVFLYFFYWVNKVWQNKANANFIYTMRMNWLASICTNAAFITLLILNHLD